MINLYESYRDCELSINQIFNKNRQIKKVKELTENCGELKIIHWNILHCKLATDDILRKFCPLDFQLVD